MVLKHLHTVLPMGFSPRQVHYGFNETKEMTVEHFGGERVYTQLYSHGGRSITRVLSTQSKSACSKLVSASGPLCLHNRPLGLCPQHCHHSSLCSVFLQPCSRATVSPRPLGGALYIESIATYCPHVCSEQADQGQVGILATRTFILSTVTLRHFIAKLSV